MWAFMDVERVCTVRKCGGMEQIERTAVAVVQVKLSTPLKKSPLWVFIGRINAHDGASLIDHAGNQSKPELAASGMGFSRLSRHRRFRSSLSFVVHQQDVLALGANQAHEITDRSSFQIGGDQRGMAEWADDTNHGSLLLTLYFYMGYPLSSTKAKIIAWTQAS